MSDGELVRGNFGRYSGEPARAGTSFGSREDSMTSEERVVLAVEQVRNYYRLVEKYRRENPGQAQAYEDSIVNTLDCLDPDEQERALTALDRGNVVNFKKEEQ